MNHIKQLAGQTMIYGMGIVLPRLLSYLLLTPFYTRIFSREEYGIVTELYAYIVFLIVILTYGLETGFFRFSDKNYNRDDVYKTSLTSIFVTSSIFILLILSFSGIIANVVEYSENPEYIRYLGLIVALDAFSAIPFAKIRLENKPVKYAVIRIIEVGITIAANWFFLYYCPRNYHASPLLEYVYNADIGVGYVLISNLLATGMKTLFLSGEIFIKKGIFDPKLLKKILIYCLPLLIAGLAGTVNEAIDRVLLKHLLPKDLAPLQQLGVYGASYKLAVLMTLFIQMFRYAAEPFFFSKKDETNAKAIYAEVMKYFVFSGVLIFLVVTMYIDVFKLFIGPQFREGIKIVPIILMANLFMGIFYNLSVWYKLKNLTKYGAYLVIIGAIITFIINYVFIPKYGYYASAWGHFTSYLVMIILSYFLGRRIYKIDYNVKKLLLWIFIAVLIYIFFENVSFENTLLEYSLKTLILIFLIVAFYLNEKHNKESDESSNR